MNGNLPLQCLAVAFLLLPPARVNSQVTGIPPAHARIVGTVFDEQAQPLKNIFVHAVSDETGKFMPTVDSDEDGHFVIEELQPGTYNVFGENGAADYPDTSLPFYSNENQVKATVRDFDTATIVLVLGPKAGVLRGEVLDKTTGKAIEWQHAPNEPQHPPTFIVRKVSNQEQQIP